MGSLGGDVAGHAVSSVLFFLFLSSEPVEDVLVTVGSLGLFSDGEDGVGVDDGCDGCIGMSGEVYPCRLCGIPGVSLEELEGEVDVGGVKMLCIVGVCGDMGMSGVCGTFIGMTSGSC